MTWSYATRARARRCGPSRRTGRGPAHGHQRQPDHLLHLRHGRRAGRRGRRACTSRPSAPPATTRASSSGLFAFTAAVLGGIGNLTGAVLGGVLIGLIRASTTAVAGLGQEWTQTVVFTILILLMVFKPDGPARRPRGEGVTMAPDDTRRAAGRRRPAELDHSRLRWPLGFGAAGCLLFLLQARACRVLEPAYTTWSTSWCRSAINDGADLGRCRARPEHRGRLRRPARPGLRGLLGDRRVHRRLVHVATSSPEVDVHFFGIASPAPSAASTSTSGCVIVAALRLRALRHHHRRADAAAAQRLSGAGHAGLRRDHPAGLPQRRRLCGFNISNGTQGITPMDPVEPSGHHPAEHELGTSARSTLPTGSSSSALLAASDHLHLAAASATAGSAGPGWPSARTSWPPARWASR